MTSASFEATIEWAHVHKPSKYGAYEVNALLDTPEQLAKAEGLLEALSIGLVNKDNNARIKTKEDGTKYLKFRRNAVNRQGTPAVIDVVDASGAIIPANVMIGNGSRAIIHFFTYKLPSGGTGFQLGKLQVLDLVKLEGTGGIKPMKGFSINDLNQQQQG